MYTFESRIRQSEADRNELLKYSGIVDYFQDCAIFQTNDLGVGNRFLHDELKTAWVLSTWNIEIVRRPAIGEMILTGTAPYELKGFFGKRNFRMSTPEGEILSVADSLWTMLDLRTGKPCRVPEEVVNAYTPEEKLPMEYIRSRIEIPDGLREMEKITVTEHYIDSNLHMNNSRYVEIAADCAEMEDIKRIRVEYHRQARRGDVLIPLRGETEKGCVIVIADPEGERICVAEFLRA